MNTETDEQYEVCMQREEVVREPTVLHAVPTPQEVLTRVEDDAGSFKLVRSTLTGQYDEALYQLFFEAPDAGVERELVVLKAPNGLVRDIYFDVDDMLALASLLVTSAGYLTNLRRGADNNEERDE
jgi:hypothetical protein